jgi:hypothetical protein
LSTLLRAISIQNYDVIIIGGGAAGLMAAATSAKRGRNSLLLEHSNLIGEKIRISGGGRCNFTNRGAGPSNYISNNPHFVKSALSSYSQHDFIKLVEAYNISYHEKTLGQLFCDGASNQIIDMLVSEIKKNHGKIITSCQIKEISKSDHFTINCENNTYSCQSLIIATGGLSIPKLGASDFGYRVARQFNLKVTQTQPALVPLLLQDPYLKQLAGISLKAIATYHKANFLENILFTHRGLSGPAILQISSYLEQFSNSCLELDLLPDIDLAFAANKNSTMLLGNYLKQFFPNRFVDVFIANNFENKKLTDYKKSTLDQVESMLKKFKVAICGSEGYQKAEVTRGGIDTSELSSKTMQSKKVPGLYFIGEVVDVTGWLGGYNFQWAWSSGYAAGSNA